MTLIDEKFVGQYQKSITLRNELIPIGKTVEHIEELKFLSNDQERADNYQKVKPLIDDVYRAYIDEILSQTEYDWTNLSDSLTKFKIDKSEANKNLLAEAQKEARDFFGAWFSGKAPKKTKDPNAETHAAYFDKLFKEKLFSDILLCDTSKLTEDEKNLVSKFNKFNTYFTGFYETRKNVFTSEEISTAVPYRLVHDNFPKFLGNIEVYEAVKAVCPQVLDEITKELQSAGILQGSLEDVFCVKGYNNFLKQADIAIFNDIIGGQGQNVGKQKIQGFNEKVNVWMQQHPADKAALKNKPHRMLPLFKQILSDREAPDYIVEQFTSDAEVFAAVSALKKELVDKNIISRVEKLFLYFNNYDMTKIYVSHKSLTQFSLYLTGIWSAVNERYTENAEARIIAANKGKNPSKKAKDAIQSKLKTVDLSMQELMDGTTGLSDKENNIIDITDYAKVVLEAAKKTTEEIKLPLPKSFKSRDDKNTVKTILEAMTNLHGVLKVLAVGEDNELDNEFYGELSEILAALVNAITLYNKVRNYATKKPYSESKIKLNFDLPQLGAGWDQNKEDGNGTFMLEKDGEYYLAISNRNNKPKWSEAIDPLTADGYKKMVYKQFKDLAKMLPKCTVSRNDVKSHFENSDDAYSLEEGFIKPLTITKEIYDLNNTLYDGQKRFQIGYLKNTGDTVGYYDALHKWIDFAKSFLNQYRSTAIYELNKILPTVQYERLDAFYKDVDDLCYSLKFENANKDVVNQWVNTGKILLFKIHNKDFAKNVSGKDNLHTMYFKNLFSKENLSQPVIKLNGGAELFYRAKTKNMPIVMHKKGTVLVNKVDVQGNPISDEVYVCLSALANKQSLKTETVEEKHNKDTASKMLADKMVNVKVARYDIIKDKRYTQDKWFFHLPITINFRAAAKPTGYNGYVNTYLKENKDVNIIGLDRGERNLIYAVVINQKGEIIDRQQISFNEVRYEKSGQNKLVARYDYHAKLEQRERERVAAKQAWDVVGKIKEIKEGYLSAVVRKLADLMIKYNAILVMENLNAGFKRVRGGISEKAVYQKFEKMLVEKLNYLVFKERSLTEAGGLLRGYQLTGKFESFEKMGNQSGFLFYVPAAYTSKIDPVTGFANVISMRGITNKEAKKDFLAQFTSVKYVKTEDAFVIDCDLSKFKVAAKSYKTKWELWAKGKRIVYHPGKPGNPGTYENMELSSTLKAVLDKFGIIYANGENILPEICGHEAVLKNVELFDTVYRVISATLQMRNSNKATGEDYIISPVRAKDSDVFISSTTNYKLPIDADANGAYHIALKGLYLLTQINASDNSYKVKLGIKNEDWFKFVQSREFAN